jgi:hypothetical protein
MSAVAISRRCFPQLLILLPLIAGGGCNLPFLVGGLGATLTMGYDDYDVLVLDGDTGKPISKARVRGPHSGWGGSRDSGLTDKNGRERLRVARHIEKPEFTAYADGYLWGDLFTGTVSRNDKDVTIELYRPPAPLTGITVPKDFRGVVRVRVGRGNDPWPTHSTWQPGQREFYAPIEVTGVTVLLASPIPRDIKRYGAGVSIARFDDGTPLRYENPIAGQGWAGEHLFGLPDIRDLVPPRPDGVALFHLGSKAEGPGPPYNGYEMYFIGTEQEAAVVQQGQVRGSTPLVPEKSPAAGQYTFTSRPLSISELPVGTELSPRWAG